MLIQERLVYGKKKENQNNACLEEGIEKVIHWEGHEETFWGDDGILYLGQGLVCKVKTTQMVHLRHV